MKSLPNGALSPRLFRYSYPLEQQTTPKLLFSSNQFALLHPGRSFASRGPQIRDIVGLREQQSLSIRGWIGTCVALCLRLWSVFYRLSSYFLNVLFSLVWGIFGNEWGLMYLFSYFLCAVDCLPCSCEIRGRELICNHGWMLLRPSFRAPPRNGAPGPSLVRFLWFSRPDSGAIVHFFFM